MVKTTQALNNIESQFIDTGLQTQIKAFVCNLPTFMFLLQSIFTTNVPQKDIGKPFSRKPFLDDINLFSELRS